MQFGIRDGWISETLVADTGEPHKAFTMTRAIAFSIVNAVIIASKVVGTPLSGLHYGNGHQSKNQGNENHHLSCAGVHGSLKIFQRYIKFVLTMKF
jgi:hypothetical protein